MSNSETTPVLLSATRTPIGRYLGGLAKLQAPELGSIVIREAVTRAGIEDGAVDEVIMGNVLQGGEGQAPARQAAVHAGIPGLVPALTVNKVCGSGHRLPDDDRSKLRCLEFRQATQITADGRPRCTQENRRCFTV